jgi:DNA-binding NarL/FixJ family response regulator
VIVVADDPPFRAVLEPLLGPHCSVHAVSHGRTAVAQLDVIDPVVAIVDLELRDTDGIALLRALRAVRPTLPVIVVAATADPDHVVAAIDAGASGYLLKDGIRSELVPAVEAAQTGGTPLSPRVATHVVRIARETRGAAPTTERPLFLTGSERHVLGQLARGLTYEQIGVVLHISINTVRSRVRAIYDKLDVSSRTEAVVVATQRGLIRLTT